MNFKSLFTILSLVIVFCTTQTNVAQTAVTWTAPLQRHSPTHNTHHTDSSHPAARHPGHPKPNSQPQPTSPWYGTKFSKPSASTLRESILDQIQPPSVKKNRISANKPSSNTAENQEPVCDLQGFANKQGSVLAEHILSMDFSCLGELFDSAEKSIRIRAFRASNMLSIAEITEQRANSYDGDDELLANYYLYLRTGYYNHFYHAEEMDWLPDNETQVDQAMISALTAFTENLHFFDISREHAIVLNEVITATDNAEQQKHFLPVYKQYLKQFNQNRVDQESIAIAVNSIFIALFRGHQRSEFRQAVAEDFELIRILKNFALSDWLLGTSVEWLAGNSSLELARFLEYNETSIYPAVVSAVQDIFNRYDFFSGEGFEISVWALKNVLYFEKCEEFQVCEVKEQLKEQVFSTGKHQCHQTSVRIQSQNLTEEQLMNACEILADQEMYFHDKLMTHQTPVRDDFNEILSAIVFSNVYNYILYSDLFFGNDTNNGGIYLEGDPSDPSNTARFFAYRAEWLEGEPVWNLEHEHVHYLDGRFNLYGSFRDYKIDTHNTVWWAEGLAEYISLKDDNPRAFKVLLESSQAPTLSQIFKTTYNSPIDFVYRWSYFAIRFIFEEYPSEVDRFLQYFREGQYDDYLEYLNISIGSKYNAEFSEWLEELKDKHIPTLSFYESDYIINTINTSRIDLLPHFSSIQNPSFFVVSSNPSVVQVEIDAGRFLILKPRSPGVSEIIITAQSSNSKMRKSLTVKVVSGIRTFAPRFSQSLSTFSIFDKTRTIDLSKYVEGPPKEDIIFTAESLNPDIASVHLEGSLLTITYLRKGLAYIKFLAKYGDLSYERSFQINIADGESFAKGYCFGEPLNNQQSYIAEISLAGRRIADHKNSTYSLSNAGNINTIYAFTGSSYTLGITAGTSSPIDDDRIHRVEAWVDWNRDKIFSTESEKVMDQQVVLSNTDIFPKISSVLTVPEDIQIGYVRLRVRISSGGENDVDNCSNYDSGEIEDHLVWVYPGPVHIQVNNIAGEKQSVLKIKTSTKEIPLSEVFYTHDNSTLTYSAVSSHPDTAEVQIENNKLIIRKAVSAENFEPAIITLTAEIPAIDRRMTKEFSVVFEPYVLPLILSADDENRESFVRIINNSDQNGVIYISGRDDSGRVGDSVSLSLSAGGSAHFNSRDLENGNENKGLIGALGSGQGDWRLTLTSDLDFHASSYIRLKGDGFVTSMTQKTTFEMESDSYTYFVPIFNPASNQNQRSLLKLFNPNTSSALINITGIDDRGFDFNVQLNLPPKGSRIISSEDLEKGAEYLEGHFGNGQGKWRLELNSSHSIGVMNLMESPTGHLSNLSYNPLSSSNTDMDLHKMLLPEQDNRHGFIRIINHSDRDGEITITATDDLSRRYNPIQLSISAGEAKHFNSYDLQNGNEDKGLPHYGLGAPQGMWRLKFESDLNISVMSYMRSSNGFLTSLDSALPVGSPQNLPIYDNNRYSAYFFNPASNQNQRSIIRFINNDTHEPAFVSIQGVDDKGVSSGEVSFTMPARSTKTVSSLDLETGFAEGLNGFLGDGYGKWHLRITTSRPPLLIMNLLESPNGYMSNLSIP